MSNTPSRFRRKARTTTITLTVDSNDEELLSKAANNVLAARRGVDMATDDNKQAARKHLRDAEKAWDEASKVPTVELTFRLIPGSDRERLLDANPATDKQQAVYDAAAKPDGAPKTMTFNPDTYFPALIAEACTRVLFSDEPDNPADAMTVEEATDLWETASDGDRMLIQQTLQLLTISSSRVPDLGNG